MAEQETNPYEWVYDHSRTDADGNPLKVGKVNDRLIDLLGWLPGALSDSQLSEVLSVFQDYLNFEEYEESGRWSDEAIAISVLGKIAGISRLRDPDSIDRDFLYSYLDNLGFRYSSLAQLNGVDDETDRFNRTREIARSAPFFFSEKATEVGISSLLSIFGFTASFDTMWTDSEEGYRNGDFYPYDSSVSPESGPTPHFGMVLDVGHSSYEITDFVSIRLRDTIEKIRPINAVFDGLGLKMSVHNFSQDGSGPNGLRLTIPDVWTNDFQRLTGIPVFEGMLYVDPRDNAKYWYAEIGDAHWMLRNFDFGEAVTNPNGSSAYGNKFIADQSHPEYGGLYDWRVAIQTCPNGWHLPTEAEMQDLFVQANGGSTAGSEYGKQLKAKPSVWDGTDTIGFNFLPGGDLFGNGTPDAEFENQGTEGHMWLSTPEQKQMFDSEVGLCRGMLNAKAATGDDLVRLTRPNNIFAFSMRLVKNRRGMTEGITVDDRDGTPYRWKKIGNLYWMIDNLMYGTVVPDSTTTLQPGQAWELKIPWTYGSTDYVARAGYSYSREVAEDAIPTGWRLPGKADWADLRDSLVAEYGGSTTAGTDGRNEIWTTTTIGGKMKTDGTWPTGTGGDDASGWFGMQTKDAYALYHCYEEAEKPVCAGGDWRPYAVALGASDGSLTLASAYGQFPGGIAPNLENNYNIAIRCCRNTQPDAHTESDWHDWYGQPEV